MRLLTAHKILIVAAMALAIFFGFLSLSRWRASGATADLLITITSWVVAGVFGGYYVSLKEDPS